MDGRALATIILSGTILALGVAQVIRAGVTGAGVFAYVVGLLFIVAGGGRLWLWWRSRGT